LNKFRPLLVLILPILIILVQLSVRTTGAERQGQSREVAIKLNNTENSFLAINALSLKNAPLSDIEGKMAKKGISMRSMPITKGKVAQKETSIIAFMDKLAFCESGNDPKAIGDKGKAKGIFQFHQETFDIFGEKFNLPHDNIWSVEQQKDIAFEMLLNGGQNHWANCSQKINKVLTMK